MPLSQKDRAHIVEESTAIKELGLILSNKVEALNKYYARVLTNDQKEKDNICKKENEEAKTIPRQSVNKGSTKKANGKKSSSGRSVKQSSTQNKKGAKRRKAV